MQKENILMLFGADSSLQWGRSYQIAKAFSSMGHKVLYIDLPLSLQKGFCPKKQKDKEERFEVFQPLLGLPCAKFAWLRQINFLIQKQQLNRYLEKTGFSPSIVWAYAPYEPRLAKYIKETYNPHLVVHDIADERIALAETQSGQRAARVTKKYEEEIAGYCDAVITITEKLRDTKKHLHESIFVMPNGVDMDMFKKNAEYTKPEYFPDTEGKVVLYIGAIEEWVDVEAIYAAAASENGLDFLCVGPVRSDISKLKQLRNVHLIGSKPYSEMPGYIAHSDVCILPFKDNEITRNSDPLKLLQYLSMGKPVVALKFEGINDFGGAVSAALTYQEFSNMIHLAAEQTDNVPAIVYEYDWKNLLSRTLGLLEGIRRKA
ncbi:MAG: glycosyltransferase [Nitrospirae bacterium]|nr:glycosyltransferase [Nitrospirota bacterium]